VGFLWFPSTKDSLDNLAIKLSDSLAKSAAALFPDDLLCLILPPVAKIKRYVYTYLENAAYLISSELFLLY